MDNPKADVNSVKLLDIAISERLSFGQNSSQKATQRFDKNRKVGEFGNNSSG